MGLGTAAAGTSWTSIDGARALAAFVPAVALVAWLAVAPAAAREGMTVGVIVHFPTRVALGGTETGAAVTVVNGSTGAASTGPLTVSELTLVPSCADFSPTCARAADAGVFRLSDRGTGALGTNCAGRVVRITVVDGATGRVAFRAADGAPLVLAAPSMATDLDTCRIHFTIAALRPPSVDSHPGVDGLQTNQVAFVSVRHAAGAAGDDQGEDVTTLVGDPPSPPLATTTTTTPPSTTTTSTTTTSTTTTSTTTTSTTTTPPSTTTTTAPTAGDGLDRTVRTLLDLISDLFPPGR